MRPLLQELHEDAPEGRRGDFVATTDVVLPGHQDLRLHDGHQLCSLAQDGVPG
jgi:hypothetical protein